MPLVFVHGVATRDSAIYQAERDQRSALFRKIVFNDPSAKIFNPDWGDKVPVFSQNGTWLPKPQGIPAFGAGAADLGMAPQQDVGLSTITKTDSAQAIDLVIGAALNKAISENPESVAIDPSISLAKLAADYLSATDVVSGGPKRLPALDATNDAEFGHALADALKHQAAGAQSFGGGIGQSIQDALGSFGGWIGNGLSDAVLRAKRKDLSERVALFLGDIFVYLRNRDVPGQAGTESLLFRPIMDSLVNAAQARRTGEPLVVVGHSLGGVMLYDILTDPFCFSFLREKIGDDLNIDLFLTVGSQAGFFKDLGLYLNKPVGAQGKLARPASAANWLNVCDFTDVFSFLCAPFFEDVEDFTFDTAVDLFNAHSAYFKKVSFYTRLRLRLIKLGYL